MEELSEPPLSSVTPCVSLRDARSLPHSKSLTDRNCNFPSSTSESGANETESQTDGSSKFLSDSTSMRSSSSDSQSSGYRLFGNKSHQSSNGYRPLYYGLVSQAYSLSVENDHLRTEQQRLERLLAQALHAATQHWGVPAMSNETGPSLIQLYSQSDPTLSVESS